MKFIIILIFISSILCLTSCKEKGETGNESKTMMEMDSTYTLDKNITIIESKDEILLIESMKIFEDNPNVLGSDIDAGKNISSPEIQFIRPNDTIKLIESRDKKDK